MSAERYDIPCANCRVSTGAVFMGGDPYLPYILCTPCADVEEANEGSGVSE